MLKRRKQREMTKEEQAALDKYEAEASDIRAHNYRIDAAANSALIGILSNPRTGGDFSADEIASRAYKQACAVVKGRERFTLPAPEKPKNLEEEAEGL